MGEALKQDALLFAASKDMYYAIRAILFQVAQGKVLERDACITMAKTAWNKANGLNQPPQSTHTP